MKLSIAALAMQGALIGKDLEFESVSTDTRTLQAGDVFVALKGPNFNGHDCIQQALDAGAIALVVSEDITAPLNGVPFIRVEQCLRALGLLANAWRKQFNLQIAAITGSCGKTSVKEMAAAILALNKPTLATHGNYNNDIGVPLTLLRLNASHRYAVIELGANHLGEIAYTTQITSPDVAVITNAGNAHIEGFGSTDNVIRAKGEIYEGLSDDGVALINADEPGAQWWEHKTTHNQQRFFSITDTNAQYYVSDCQLQPSGCWSFKVHTPIGDTAVTLPVLGKHNITNALTAAAVAIELGASLSQVQQGLEALQPIKGRLFPIVLQDQLLIDDTYNASPSAIKAAADMLGDFDNRTCIVLGDMAELGAHSTSIHRDVGAYIASKGIELFIVRGKHAADYLVGFNQHKSTEQRGVRFDTYEEVVECIHQENPPTILVKGSRSAAMECVVDKLVSAELTKRAN